MLRTITLGSCVYVQGLYVRNLASGKIAIRVGNRVFEGFPIEPAVAA